ncbi:MAG: hypothetical protein JO356_04420 [Acidobacteria bacterium]|nr:hypothetical protein [Acidobacteriota bacterium]
MTSCKGIGMDVHKESISVAIRNTAGKIVMEGVIETKASTILDFIEGLNRTRHLRGSTWSAWLYELLKRAFPSTKRRYSYRRSPTNCRRRARPIYDALNRLCRDVLAHYREALCRAAFKNQIARQKLGQAGPRTEKAAERIHFESGRSSNFDISLGCAFRTACNKR